MKSKKRKSKKRSNTKKLPANAKPLENVVFFVDRSTGKHGLPNGLKKLGLNVEKHDDHFNQLTPDIEWLSYCGERNWVVISSDLDIKRNILEKRVLLASKVASFFFTSAQLSAKQQLQIFTKALKRVKNYVLNQERPFIARIHPDGKVELWINSKGEDCLLQKLERRKQRKLKKT